jgi:hypothetical protein
MAFYISGPKLLFETTEISTHPNSIQQETNYIYLYTTKFGTSIKIQLNRKFESTEFETMRVNCTTMYLLLKVKIQCTTMYLLLKVKIQYTVDSRYLEFDGTMDKIRVNRSLTQEELRKYRECSLFNDEKRNFEELKPASHVPILGTILNIFDVFVAVFFSLLNPLILWND